MRLLIDTHTFLWFILDSPRLSPTAKALIEDINSEVYVSLASLWEIAIKTSLQKLTLPMPFEEFIPDQVFSNNMLLLPIQVSHLNGVAKLPFFHRDPFDRLLIAQSASEQMPLISRDSVFDLYSIVRLWDAPHAVE